MGTIRLPQHIWQQIDNDRTFDADMRVLWGLRRGANRGIPSVHLGSYLKLFVGMHHSLKILWPSDEWLYLHGEGLRQRGSHGARFPLPGGGLDGRDVKMPPTIIRMLRARAIKDGTSSQAVLRRLMRQHFDGPPTEWVRTTCYQAANDIYVCKDCATRI